MVSPFFDGVPLKGVRREHLADRIIVPGLIDPSSFGGSGVITVIDPDDPAAAGSTGLIADAGHQHPWTTGAASSLGKTASNTEGSSSSGARADHGHSTDTFCWGRMSPRFSSTSSAGPYSTGATTDFALADMVVDSTRLYLVCVHSHLSCSAAATYDVNFHVDGTATLEMYHAQIVAGTGGRIVNALSLWEPSSGTKDLDLRVVTSGGATMTFDASSTEPRYFWVMDIGLR